MKLLTLSTAVTTAIATVAFLSLFIIYDLTGYLIASALMFTSFLCYLIICIKENKASKDT